MGAVVTAKSGYDIGYPVRGLNRGGERTVGGYYANAALAGEAPGRWSWAEVPYASALASGAVRRLGSTLAAARFVPSHRFAALP